MSTVNIRKGMKFGHWVVSDDTVLRGKGRQAKVQCQCVCGREHLVDVWTLRAGKTKQCNACKYTAQIKPLKKQQYGRWTVVGEPFSTRKRNALVQVQCECGATQTVPTNSLKQGSTTQCRGCAGTKPWTKEERVIAWALISARRRCTNPADAGFKHYGGRGITFNFASIQEGVTYVLNNLGPRPKGLTLDRIYNDGNYEPGNLRWAPPSTQRLNSRGSKLEKISNALILECINKPARRRLPR